MIPDYLLSLVGRRVLLELPDRMLRGRLISVRDGLLTVEPDRGQRLTINQYVITSIQADPLKVSRCPRLSRAFWR